MLVSKEDDLSGFGLGSMYVIAESGKEMQLKINYHRETTVEN